MILRGYFRRASSEKEIIALGKIHVRKEYVGIMSTNIGVKTDVQRNQLRWKLVRGP